MEVSGRYWIFSVYNHKVCVLPRYVHCLVNKVYLSAHLTIILQHTGILIATVSFIQVG